MFKKLQEKWGVRPAQLFLILTTFAVGGSLTGWLGKKIMSVLQVKPVALYLPIYLIVITLIWPIMVMLVSLPMGQFPFFKTYLAKLWRRIGGRRKDGGGVEGRMGGAEAGSKK